jgi:hypothetical protein
MTTMCFEVGDRNGVHGGTLLPATDCQSNYPIDV